MADADVYKMFANPDDASAEEQAQAFQAALRRKNDIGQLAMLTGDPTLGKLGGAMLQGAEGDQQMVATAGGQRLTRALQMAREQREQATDTARLGLEKQRVGLEQQRASAEAWIPVQTADGVKLMNKRTGQYRAMTDANGAQVGSKGSGGKPGDLDKALKGLQEDLDPSRAKAGVLADNQKRINATERLLTLATDPKTGEAMDLDPRQMRELATSLNGVLTSGAMGAESGIHELVPQTMRGNLAKLEEYLGNSPSGTGQREFVHKMVETAKRERETAKRLIREAQMKRLASHAGLRAAHPQEYGEVIKSYGLGDGPDGGATSAVHHVRGPDGGLYEVTSEQLAAALAGGGKQVD